MVIISSSLRSNGKRLKKAEETCSEKTQKATRTATVQLVLGRIVWEVKEGSFLCCHYAMKGVRKEFFVEFYKLSLQRFAI